MKYVKLPQDINNDLINVQETSSGQVVTRALIRKQKIKKFLKRAWDFFVSKPNPKESIIQWILRQFILADSSGNPSWTITIAFIVIVYIGISMMVELSVATSVVKVYDKTTGVLVSESLKGVSDSFWYLLITLGGAVTYLFQQRGKRINTNGNGTSETSPTVDGVIEKAVNTIKKMTGK